MTSKRKYTREELESLIDTNPNVRAFLDTISQSEGTYGKNDNGYDSLYGNKTFSSYGRDYSAHPKVYFRINKNTTDKTSAAGRYQIINKTWGNVSKQYGLTDFSPRSQDIAALGLAAGRGALDDIINGNVKSWRMKLKDEWVSLAPNKGGKLHGNQGYHSEDKILSFYNKALNNDSANNLAQNNAVTIQDNIDLTQNNTQNNIDATQNIAQKTIDDLTKNVDNIAQNDTQDDTKNAIQILTQNNQNNNQDNNQFISDYTQNENNKNLLTENNVNLETPDNNFDLSFLEENNTVNEPVEQQNNPFNITQSEQQEFEQPDFDSSFINNAINSQVMMSNYMNNFKQKILQQQDALFTRIKSYVERKFV